MGTLGGGQGSLGGGGEVIAWASVISGSNGGVGVGRGVGVWGGIAWASFFRAAMREGVNTG